MNVGVEAYIAWMDGWIDRWIVWQTASSFRLHLVLSAVRVLARRGMACPLILTPC